MTEFDDRDVAAELHLEEMQVESAVIAGWVWYPNHPWWDLVEPEWFTEPHWTALWAWVTERREAEKPCQLVDLIANHQDLGVHAMEATVAWRDTVTYPEFVLPPLRQQVEARRIKAILSAGLRLDPEQRDPAEWTMEALQKELNKRSSLMGAGRTASEGVVDLTEYVRHITHDGQEQSGITTGYPELDSHLFMLQPEDLVVIAGRPATGKTTLVLNMVRDICSRQRKNVGYISLEMGERSLFFSWAAQTMGKPLAMLMSPLSPAVEKAFDAVMDPIYHWPLRLSDKNMGLDGIRELAREWHRQQALDVLFVDYLQLVEFDGSKDNDAVQLGHISVGLKRLARELQIPVVVISSLSRAVEGRQSPEPQLSDLRGSGQIEHDADKVLFTFKPGSQGPAPGSGLATVGVKVDKIRQGGRLGTLYLMLDPQSQRMMSLSRRAES
ncbi:MAG: AAA family ATPase [Gammaproteobacteria bacterium]|nr:AAA family ATPase [Gammaproteobacteria bacterium]